LEKNKFVSIIIFKLAFFFKKIDHKDKLVFSVIDYFSPILKVILIERLLADYYI